MNRLSGLEPQTVWRYFEEICMIPRLSKSEEKIRKYLLKFAEDHNLEAKEDSTGNILIIKPASPGFSHIKTVVLQSHMDMVGEKNAGFPHDWKKDPIIPHIEDGWVTARGTTLGADDGIGIACQLAILADPDFISGRIECLFTVDEESGMTGALNLSPDFFEGRTLLNLDSEDEGIIFIGCAGGIDTIGELEYDTEKHDKEIEGLMISVTGLRGGHSGDEIHKGYGNAVKIMARILRNLNGRFRISLFNFDGGNLRNAIPREAFSVIGTEKQDKQAIIEWINDFEKTINDEIGDIENELKISIKGTDPEGSAIDPSTRDKLINLLTCCPHGVLGWSREMEGLVETSTNLASVKFTGNKKITIVSTQRSSVESLKKEAAMMVEACLRLAGASVEHSDGYPGWKPNPRSEILSVTSKSYKRLFGREPLVKAIHAGLECGLFYEKFRGIDMVSFGPTIRGAHTPTEKIEIETVRMFWDLLRDVIINMPAS